MLHAFIDPTPTPESLPSIDPSYPPSLPESLQETLLEDSHSARNRAQVAVLQAALAQYHALNAQIERSALADASAAARLAHRDHERRALDLQMNDRSGFGA